MIFITRTFRIQPRFVPKSPYNLTRRLNIQPPTLHLVNKNQRKLNIDDFKEYHWKPQKPFDLSLYKSLIKSKLSAFVVLTTISGYIISPGIFDIYTFLYSTIGTGLCIASANSLNQWIEQP